MSAAKKSGRCFVRARPTGRIARQIAAEQKIQSGLVFVLTSVEPCMSFQVVPNRQTKKLDFKQRKEGIRIKHYIDGNLLQVYDKAYTEVGCIARIETTINDVGPFRS
jgi:hypothetical protein